MKTLTLATQGATEQPITTPGFLVEIAWPTIVRLSSRAAVSWGGQAWLSGRLGKVQAKDGGTLELMNGDNAYSALVLNDGAADIGVRVWTFYTDTPAEDDPVLVFQGVADGADLAQDRVRLTLAAENARTLFSPRRFINRAAGFNHLRPAGTKITWGGQTITLERSR